MMTRSKLALYRVTAFAVLAVIACSPPPPPGGTSDAGVSFDDLQLTRLETSPLWVELQGAQTLRVQVTNLQSQPVADVPIEWSFFPSPATHAKLEGAPLTDATGTALATVTMGDESESFTIRASLPNGGAYVEWEIRSPQLALRAITGGAFTATDAPANLHVVGSTPIQATITLPVELVSVRGAIEVPVPNERVQFQVYQGVNGTSFVIASNPGFVEVITNAVGQATVPLKMGLTTGSVKVLASHGNLPPVLFDLNAVIP